MERIESALEGVNASKAIRRGFRNDTWAEKNYTLYRFMVSYAFLNSFFDASGVLPELVAGEAKNSGLWTAMAISGMITCEEGLALLSGKKKSSDMEFVRPAIPFFDPVSRKTIVPFHLG